jgi:hypothetical protein
MASNPPRWNGVDVGVGIEDDVVATMIPGGMFEVDVTTTIAVELIMVVESKINVVRTTDVMVDVVEFPASAPWCDLEFRVRNKDIASNI